MAMGQLDLPITREEKLVLADALLACLVKLDNLAERQAEEKARMRNERKSSKPRSRASSRFSAPPGRSKALLICHSMRLPTST